MVASLERSGRVRRPVVLPEEPEVAAVEVGNDAFVFNSADANNPYYRKPIRPTNSLIMFGTFGLAVVALLATFNFGGTSGAVEAQAKGEVLEVMLSDPLAPSDEEDTQLPPPRPVRINEMSRQGAIDTVQYYLKCWEYSLQTGDVKPLQLISNPECRICRGMQRTASEYHSDDNLVDTGNFSNIRINVTGKSVDNYQADLIYETPALTVKDKKGIVVLEKPAQQMHGVLHLRYQKGMWMVVDGISQVSDELSAGFRQK